MQILNNFIILVEEQSPRSIYSDKSCETPRNSCDGIFFSNKFQAAACNLNEKNYMTNVILEILTKYI